MSPHINPYCLVLNMTYDPLRMFAPPVPRPAPVKVINLAPKGQSFDSPITDRYVINFVVSNEESKTVCCYEHMIDDGLSMDDHCDLVTRFLNAVGSTFDDALVAKIQEDLPYDEDLDWSLKAAVGPECHTSVLSKVYVEYYDHWGKICKVDIEIQPEEE